MSDLSTSSNASVTPRPVSLFTVLAIFVTFTFFLLLVYYGYLRKPTQAPGPFTGDGIHTAQQREDNLRDLRKKQNEQAASYGWVDKKTGIVQLPIDRAIELTAQQYGAKK
jgi:hypothetical protein